VKQNGVSWRSIGCKGAECAASGRGRFGPQEKREETQKQKSAMKTTLRFLVMVLILGALDASGATRYVNVGNPYPEFPYDEFAKAATVIQDAVDVAEAGI